MISTLRSSRKPSAVLLILTVLAGSNLSCSSAHRVRLYPVHGQVFYNDRPVSRGLLVLHPLSGQPEAVQKPIAYTDEAGRFTVTTDRPGDGAAAGEYIVTVELREKTQTGVEKVRGRNLLPDHYSKPESSSLRCRVQEGKNELLALYLTDE